MFRFFKLPHLAAVLAGMALLAAPGLQAQASFAITVFVDGVNQGVALDAGSNANGFSVSNAVVSNFDISSITSTTNFSGPPHSLHRTARMNFSSVPISRIYLPRKSWSTEMYLSGSS